MQLDRRGLVQEIEVNDLDDRIALIKQQTALGVRDPRLHALAYAITQKCPARDDSCEARAIFDWITQRVCRWNAAEQKTVCQARIRYVGEPADFDTYRSPMQTLDIRAADCLPEGTLVVRRPYDLVPIEEIKPGDEILDGTGWTRVTAWWDKDVLPILRFELNNGCALRCTEDHRVFVVPKHPSSYRADQSGDREHAAEARAGQLHPGDDLLQPEALPFGDQKLDPDRALILGAYVAEGWCQDAQYRVGIAGVPDGKGVREAVFAAAQRLGLRCHERPRWIDIAGRAVVEWLAPCGTPARNKHLPSLDLDRATVEALLPGLNADGGLAPSGTFVFSTTSPLLALQYRILQRMLGRSTSIRRVDDHGGFGSHPIFRVSVRNGEKRNTRPWARVRSITREEHDAHVYDIATESGRIYLPESDIVVHNCDDGASLGLALGLINGFYVRATVTSNEGKTADHIYPEFALPKGEKAQWMPLDWTLGPGKFGRHPPQAKRWTFPVEAMPTDLPAGMRPGRGAVGKPTPLAGANGTSGAGSTALIVAVIAGAVAIGAIIIHTRRGV